MGKIIKDQFFSTTQLKTNTKSVLDKTRDLGEVFIMNNNKPNAVLMSIEKYNEINQYYIPEVEPEEWELKAIKEYKKEQKAGKLEYIEGEDVFKFLNNLR
ncbi:MAG: type II toxin-antitoxin system prevent-host-death family antitoxin [Candidatus Gracilibacteria bacterium]|nr:type II toxin-antitoxin system prevent-host-death family antitoxin [Candidatus Gracilibacteria bacterium]